MILETMTPLDFMDFRLVIKYLITIYLIAKHGYKKTKLFLGKCYFNAWWLTRQNIRLGLSSDVRGNLHTKFCFLCAKTVNLTRTIKLKKVEKEKVQTFYTLKFS